MVDAVAEAPARDGLFIPVAAPAASGSFTGRIEISGPQVEGRFEFGLVVVHPDEAAAPGAGAEPTEPPDAIPFLLEQQWKIDVRLERVSARTLSRRLIVPGTVEAASGRSAAVTPPNAGRLLAPATGAPPKPGDRVDAGAVLARVVPPLDVVLRIDQAYAESRARLAFAERAAERVAALREKGLGTAGGSRTRTASWRSHSSSTTAPRSPSLPSRTRPSPADRSRRTGCRRPPPSPRW